MVFLLGMVVLLPIVFGLTQGGIREATDLAGIWGAFSAFYILQFAGSAGAWILMAISLSALMAATLAWNPVRVIVGVRVKRADATVSPPPTPAERAGLDPSKEIVVDKNSAVVSAVLLEPLPEEMPQIDHSLMTDEIHAEDPVIPIERKRERKSKAYVTAQLAQRIAAEIGAAEGETLSFTDEDLPSPDLLTPAPPRPRPASLSQETLGDPLRESFHPWRRLVQG